MCTGRRREAATRTVNGLAPELVAKGTKNELAGEGAAESDAAAMGRGGCALSAARGEVVLATGTATEE